MRRTCPATQRVGCPRSADLGYLVRLVAAARVTVGRKLRSERAETISHCRSPVRRTRPRVALGVGGIIEAGNVDELGAVEHEVARVAAEVAGANRQVHGRTEVALGVLLPAAFSVDDLVAFEDIVSRPARWAADRDLVLEPGRPVARPRPELASLPSMFPSRNRARSRRALEMSPSTRSSTLRLYCSSEAST